MNNNSNLTGIALCSKELAKSSFCFGHETIELEGVPITFGIFETTQPPFINNLEAFKKKVLVKIHAFSCNYRDKALIFHLNDSSFENSCTYFGSDFVAEVIQVGSEVSDLIVGDRVINNNSYPHSPEKKCHPGIPTNHASQRYLLFYPGQLIKIPIELTNEVAAGFSVVSQTVYSMLRRSQIRNNSNVLITAPKSNTSLCIINALRKYDVNVFAISSSKIHENELKQMGVKELIVANPTETTEISKRIREFVSKCGYFNYVFDPFCDLYFVNIVEAIAYHGKYITCGVFDQYSEFTGKELQFNNEQFKSAFDHLILRNIEIIGNCLGDTADLKQAIQDYLSGTYEFIIDSVFNQNELKGFLQRTFIDKERFGKVICEYSD